MEATIEGLGFGAPLASALLPMLEVDIGNSLSFPEAL